MFKVNNNSVNGFIFEDIDTVNFQQIVHIVLVFLLLNFNKYGVSNPGNKQMIKFNDTNSRSIY